MPAILATLIFSALATIPSTTPGFVPASVPGTVPGLVPAAPSVGSAVVPGPAVYVTPAQITPNFVPNPALAPTAAGYVLAAPASLPVIVASTPGSVPALVPGSVPASLPVTVVAVPGVVPGTVPGFVPALVAPNAPQPALVPGTPAPATPSTPVPAAPVPVVPTTVLVAAATGVACASCSAGAGTTTYNGRTLAWTRTCAACAITTTFIGTFSSTGCSGLTGTDAANCCRAGLRDSICGVPALGRPATCTCLGNVIACPGCSTSKKGLLGLLGLLGLIPLLLCLSLLSCLFWMCCIRGTKKGPETHFATYQPQAIAMPTVEHCAPVEYCAPTHCDAGYGVTTCA